MAVLTRLLVRGNALHLAYDSPFTMGRVDLLQLETLPRLPR